MKKVRLFLLIFMLGAFVGFSHSLWEAIKKPHVYTKVELKKIAVKISKKYNVPTTIFIALIEKESRWDMYAISKSQACGLTQIMPSTAKMLMQNKPGNLFNPKLNMKLSCIYLKQLHKRYKRWDKALAHYNGGTRGHEYQQCRDYANWIISRAEYK